MTKFTRKKESEINKEAVWKDDAFGTLESYATFLTNALVADSGNFVLNVNGAWGSGKTFFVNRWAEQLRQAGHPVVEFNAWENDNEADPLTSLLAECLSSLESLLPKRSALVKNLKQKGGRIALSLGNIATQAALRKVLDDDGAKELKDLFSKETEQELIQLGGSLVQEQMKKKLERSAFTDELKTLVAKLKKEQEAPIFIFIDELDRCRPTFAIELLERVKHLFHVDGIKFVISTDSTQLVHSIGGVYGVGFDGATYLQRFFDESFTLPEPSYVKFAKLLFAPLRESIENLDDLWVAHESPEETFSTFAKCIQLSLRQQKLAFQRLLAISANCAATEERAFHFLYACFLVFLKLKNDERYSALIKPTDEHKSLTIRLSGTNLLNDILGQYSFPQHYSKYLTTYIKFAEGDHDNAMKIINSGSRDGHRIHRNRTLEERVNYRIERDCLHNFSSFKRYPALIELTAFIEP